ncbi:MAG TPA: GNAT family N-acetyltransferase [Acidobacteriaceae bacterium]|jgi:dTDP-4-amino-4,6-dideoxy-D-galactose acyltransferase
MADTPCKFLEWDTDFFGVRVARVVGDSLTVAGSSAVVDWVHDNAIDCLYFLCDTDDAESILAAESMHCHLVDVRVELTLELDPSRRDTVPMDDLRPATPEDVPEIMRIASVSHRDTRFYYDSHFPRETCDRLYARWIERSCEGYADQVFVMHLDGKPVGYMSCHLLPDGGASLGLLGVAESARGRGFGTTLVGAAFDYLREQGHCRLTIATQARNTGALRLYQKYGFQIEKTRLWYHRWSNMKQHSNG